MFRAWIEPPTVDVGDPITVHVENCSQIASQTAQVQAAAITLLEDAWCLSTGVELNASGTGSASVTGGLGLIEEAAVYVSAISSADGATTLIPDESPSTWVNPSGKVVGEVEDLIAALMVDREALYNTPIGDLHTPGSIEHRVIILVHGVLLTKAHMLPGWRIEPLSQRPSMEEYRSLLTQAVHDLDWAPPEVAVIGPEDWSIRAQSASPMAVAIFPSLWVASIPDAEAATLEMLTTALAAISANRGATGRAVALVVQQRLPNDQAATKVLMLESYAGNLLGGFISGEDQTQLLKQVRACENDPIINLGYELYAETLRDPSADARFFRLWSILEFLSGARVPSGTVVKLHDGSAWPGKENTTDYAAPQVYEYLKRPQVALQADRYESVRVWYGRRNATGHYGKLVVGDPIQSAQSWYKWAIKSAGDQGQMQGYLFDLKEAVSLSLWREVQQNQPTI